MPGLAYLLSRISGPARLTFFVKRRSMIRFLAILQWLLCLGVLVVAFRDSYRAGRTC